MRKLPPALVLLTLAAALLTAAPAAAFPVHPSTIWTIAGDGAACGFQLACGDGGAALAAQIPQPRGVAVDTAGNVFISVDAAGNIYVADQNSNRIRKVTPYGTIVTAAGSGVACGSPPFCGDGGRATEAQLTNPLGVAVDAAGGNVFIADTQDRLIRWLAGPQPGATGSTGGTGGAGGGGATGPGGPAGPAGVAVRGASGPAGTRGPAGRDARATCKVGKRKRGRVKVTCTVRLARARAARKVTARLTRGAVTYASGTARSAGAKAVLRLRAHRRIAPGAYTLTTRASGSGRPAVARQRIEVR